MRLVPALGVSYLLVKDAIFMGSAMTRGLMLFTLSVVILSFPVMKIRSQITVRIIPIRIIVLLGGGLMGFTRHTPPIIFSLRSLSSIYPLW